MRILQLIDSLDVGGAEKMAVNYANALANKISFSGLIVTRKEGPLKNLIHNEVDYVFLNKKSAIDLSAIFKLKAYCKKNAIDFLHAHTTSFFTAFLLKLVYPKIKIIWHEHTGARTVQSIKENKLLWLCAKFFTGIIVVNQELKKWCLENLNFKNIIYLPNYTLINDSENKDTFLKGIEGKRILCLANLREPKNHILLVEIATKFKDINPDWTFHLVGKDLEDNYSVKLKELIKSNNLEETVYIYGLREDTFHIIEQAAICILTSISEGLPIALLEYGLQKKAVVSTNVGEIPLIIKNEVNGFTVPSDDVIAFLNALQKLIEDTVLRTDFGNELYKTITENNSENAVVNQYLKWIERL